MTVAPQTIERTLREWVTRREALHAAETGAATKSAGVAWIMDMLS